VKIGLYEMPELPGEFFYRVEDKLCADTPDEFDNYGPPSVYVSLRKFGVVRHTKCGAWINVYGERKFVLISARKRYACPTIKEAKESFTARKKRQIRILSTKIGYIEDALYKLEEIKE
jgi:hypothetical protein